MLNHRVAELLRVHSRSRDFLCLIAGYAQKPIYDLTTDLGLMTIEYGVGYYGVFSKYRCFESYTHMHHVYGRLSEGKDYDGQNFDCVIPNYWDVNDFSVQADPLTSPPKHMSWEDDGINRKGIDIAIEATRAAGARLILSGQNAKQESLKLTTDDGQVFEGTHFKYVGYSDIDRRSHLMSNATAILCPTKYLGPFEDYICPM